MLLLASQSIQIIPEVKRGGEVMRIPGTMDVPKNRIKSHTNPSERLMALVLHFPRHINLPTVAPDALGSSLIDSSIWGVSAS